MGESFTPTLWFDGPPRQMGARFRPTPGGIPHIRAAASLSNLKIPESVRWHETMQLYDGDGYPDPLGNDTLSNCVECAELRLIQLHCSDGRRPTREAAEALYIRQAGYDPSAPEATNHGTYTDQAFNDLCSKGYQWSDQRLVVPRWVRVEGDGRNVDIEAVKLAIWALGGVVGVFHIPRSFGLDRWVDPPTGTAEAGDHAVLISGYSPDCFYVVSWGRMIEVSYSVMLTRLAQAAAFRDYAWLRPDGKTPSGLTQAQLEAVPAAVLEA